MKFARRKGIFYYSLFTLVYCQWLCGSNGIHGFEIFRSRYDIFSNLQCYGGSGSELTGCTDELHCDIYNAECVKDSDCKYCICNKADRNTFVVITESEDYAYGLCKSDEEIEPVHEETFKLQNIYHNQCLKVESPPNKFIVGTNCESSTLDMLWMWTNTSNKQLMNMKTLKCMKEPKSDGGNITMTQCRNTAKSRKIFCKSSEITDDVAKTEIGWEEPLRLAQLKKETLKKEPLKKEPLKKEPLKMKPIWPKKPLLFLQLSDVESSKLRYAISKNVSGEKRQLWNATKTQFCNTTDTNYEGCYRFSDGSFMAYLKLGRTGPTQRKINISAPIFTENSNCHILDTFEYTHSGQEWEGYSGTPFLLKKRGKNTTELQINWKDEFRAWNGSLLKFTVVCGESMARVEEGEKHCVLFKLESLPRYDKMSPTSSSTDVLYTLYQSVPTTEDYVSTTEVPSTSPSPSSNSRQSTRAVTTTLTRSGQSTEDENMSSKHPSQSPTRITSTTESPQEGFKDDASESGGKNSTAIAIAVTVTLLLVALALVLGYLGYYRRRKRAQVSQNNDLGAVNYSRETHEDPDRIHETLAVAERPTGNGAVYETLEQPGQPTDDDFFYYPDNTNIAKPPVSSELESTYAKDTGLPRGNPDSKVATQDPANSAVYHTLEQPGQPTDDDFYNYPDNSNIIKPPSSEQEYSYAKNTDMPSIPLNIQQMTNGHSSPPPNSSLYHPLEEPNPPQAPVYSTLEGPENVENHKQVTDERPSSSDHTYIEVIEDSNQTDSRNAKNSSNTSEQEYTYAKDTDFPKPSVSTKTTSEKPISNGVVYQTLEQPGQPTVDDFYNYPDNTNIAKPPVSSELEYTYAKDTGLPRGNPDTKVVTQDPANRAVYHTLEQPRQSSDDDFYYYPDNTNITKPPPSELEYTYAKDTDLPRLTADKKAAQEDPTSNAVYHTLEQEQPLTTDLYISPGTKISTELEYTYAKDTKIPKSFVNTKTVPKGDSSLAASDALYHTPGQEEQAPIEPEYSYAKNTDIPSIHLGTEQTTNGHSSPLPDNSGLYHTLEEPNPPQVPVYSTLEGPEDVENHKQVTDERPNFSDHTYIEVIEDSNKTDSRNAKNSSNIA